MSKQSIRVLSFVIIAIVSAAGVARSQTSDQKDHHENTAKKLQLEPCRLPGWNEDVKCGKYEVFEDREAKSGRKITLRLVLLPALALAQTPAPDPIFYFSGGPGGSAVDTMSRAGASYLAGLRRERDIVFVDQRGTGGSNPLVCNNLYPDKNDMSAYFSQVVTVDRLRACRAELEKIADLKQYSTQIAMDDLDEVRAAMGYDKINLYGASYGSTAALSYLRQHGDHVRTATVLGVAPPDMKLPLPVIKGVQNAIDRLIADCSSDPKCKASFPNLKSDFEAALRQLDKGPLSFDAANPFTQKIQHITLTRPVYNEFVRTMLYIPEFSKWLPLLIHQGAQGDFSLFATVSFQSFRTIEDQLARGMHFSVVCGEDVPFITDADVARENTGSFYGDYRVKAYRQVCESWPHANVPASFATPVKSDVPVLLVSGEADPVAPPWLAASAASHLSNSLHVTVPHTGHAFSFSCVDELVNKFISQGSVKQLNPSCLSAIHRPAFITPEMLTSLSESGSGDKGEAPAKSPGEQIWEGSLDVGATKLKLVLHISKADGNFEGTLDSPDQKVNGLMLDNIVWKEGTLSFEIPLIGGLYEGKTNSDSSEISGKWKQQTLNLPLIFKRSATGSK
ncbi:MAG: alpha/beta hydrolase [Blastocatellia bacterium AA13]|nr:MAG: alpha/beta hydrolase [Blastocatellia bacterium AA13]